VAEGRERQHQLGPRKKGTRETNRYPIDRLRRLQKVEISNGEQIRETRYGSLPDQFWKKLHA
jgi:hypothetical protein